MAALVLYQKQLNDMVVTVVALISQVISLAVQWKEPIPYHTSILTRQGWVTELLEGCPKHIQNELRVHKTVFRILVTELQNASTMPQETSHPRSNSQSFCTHV